MRDRREILTHILMVVAPLLMLFALSMAWFISSRTTDVSQMSFASKDTGPGAALHFGVVDKAQRQYDPAAGSLQNTVTWGPEETPEKSAITIESMVPGQCEYYLLLSDHLFSVTLVNTVYTNAAGDPPAEGEVLPLAQCLGFYLLPLTTEEQEAFDWSATDTFNCSTAKVTLGRVPETNQLQRAALKDMPAGAALIPEGQAAAAPLSTGYILAIYCDPLYLQGPSEAPVNLLEGSISFSLAFPREDA